MLYPLIRINRAIASCIIYPDHPIKAIAISEIVSVVGPLLNPKNYLRILSFLLTVSNNPHFAGHIFEIYNKPFIKYNQAEIILLLIFILTIYLKNI